jgi:hypothetical protein
VRATASAGRTIATVRIDAGGAAVDAASNEGIWSADVPLPAGGARVTFRAIAADSAGDSTETTRTFERDASPPSVTITSPASGATFATPTIDLSGSASDDLGVARVLVRVGDADPEPATGTETWTARVFLDPGTHTVTATAIDVSGQRSETSIVVHVSRVVTLRPPRDSGELTLTLDANGLDRLIPDEDERRLTLLYVDLEPVLATGLDAIKNPEAFGIDTSTWGAAERNLQRLLRMSPDNADLSGTSLEEVLSLAPNLGLPPARLLADIAGVAVDEPFLSSADTARAILRNVIETHPNIDVDPADGRKKVRVSLHDALRNFTTLAARFGPSGSHPGFLTGTTFSAALKANFAMTVTARSNLTQHEGVVPGVGKGYLFVLRDPSRPSILEFDFLDPARFQVQGIADEPTVDMTFFMTEHDGFVAGGTSQTARPDGIFFQGNSPAWTLSPWLIEHVVIDAVYLAKRDRFRETAYRHTFQYDVGAISPAALVHWDKGWITMTTAGGLGNPPAPAYFWDHLLEAAQVRLHDQGVAEGAARVQFTLRRIPLGLNADQLKERIRPQMEAQKADLSRILLGDTSAYRSDVAFYLARGADRALYLYFTAPSDVPGLTPYPFSTPGFFRDEALTRKASSTAAGTSGDTIHEKVAATAPATYFIRGADGLRYRIELLDRAGDELHLRVVLVGR